MTLFACPSELLKLIIHEVTGEDLENLASTCRFIRGLAQPMLKEHYILQKKYGHRKINYPGEEATHPGRLLDIVIRNPRAVTYIKALYLTYQLPRNIRSSKQERIKARTNKILEKYDFFWNQLVSNPFIPDGEASSWCTQIREGRIDALFALLLYYLHNLKEVMIDRPVLLPQTFVMISRLQKLIHQRKPDQLIENPPSTDLFQLSYLSKKRSRTEFRCNLWQTEVGECCQLWRLLIFSRSTISSRYISF